MIGSLGSVGICKGILSGECATREVAAYLLDARGGGFHDVPTTTYIEFYHPCFTNSNISILSNPIPSQTEQCQLKNKTIKHGPLQEFVHSSGIIGDFGVRKFLPEEIKKIALLDLRTLNCDRNDGNILVRGKKLIPIDHGLCLPDTFEIYEDYIAWMNYPQIK